MIELYHEKFAKPGLELMNLAKPLMNPVTFANKIDFIWFELWHHEGRRARHGASMMGPDYTHWHGTYEIAKIFYHELIPELEELVEQGLHSKDAAQKKSAKELQAGIKKLFESDNHKWFKGK